MTSPILLPHAIYGLNVSLGEAIIVNQGIGSVGGSDV